MWRRLATAVAAAIVLAVPVAASAQPPSPAEIVHKVDRGVRRAVTNLDHKVRHRNVTTRRTVHRTAARRVRALCNDGRFHIGRTRTTACATHGGVR